MLTDLRNMVANGLKKPSAISIFLLLPLHSPISNTTIYASCVGRSLVRELSLSNCEKSVTMTCKIKTAPTEADKLARTASCSASPNLFKDTSGAMTAPAAIIIAIKTGFFWLGRKVGAWKRSFPMTLLDRKYCKRLSRRLTEGNESTIFVFIDTETIKAKIWSRMACVSGSVVAL